MQYFLFFIGFINLNFSSLSADANQEATKRVIEAVVADHSRSNRFPWSAAEMKGNCACSSLLLGLLKAFSTIKQIHTLELNVSLLA